MTSERLRMVRRSAGLAAFGVLAYLTALTFCFPYDRAREMVVAIAARSGFDVDIASARPSFPFGMLFEDIRVRSRTATGGSKPLQARFESARVGLLPLFFSNGQAFDVVLSGLGGRIEASGRSQKKGPFHFEFSAQNINMAQLPGARELLNLPLAGTLAITAQLDSASGNFADTKGELAFKCGACSVGDGKTPIKIGGSNPFLAAGLTLPRVRLGDLGGRVAIDKGLAKLQGIEAKSPDADLTLEGEITLRDPLAYSVVNAYLRFKLGDALLKASPAIASVLQMAASPGRRPDGFYGLRLGGVFSALTSVLATTSPLAGGIAGGRAGGRPAILPVLSPPQGRHTMFPSSAPAPSPPVPSPAPEPPPPPPPPPEPVAAPPPMRGTAAGGGIVESTRGMLRGPAGATGGANGPGSPGGAPQADVVAAPPQAPPPPPPNPEQPAEEPAAQ